MDITISEDLKQYRKNKGNTQEELAEHLGISIQSVLKWEHNEVIKNFNSIIFTSSFVRLSFYRQQVPPI